MTPTNKRVRHVTFPQKFSNMSLPNPHSLPPSANQKASKMSAILELSIPKMGKKFANFPTFHQTCNGHFNTDLANFGYFYFS